MTGAQELRAQAEGERQERHQSEILSDECGEIEEDLEALRARYEMFFLGIERREPMREREEMKRRVARLKTEFTRNSGVRFRIETLHARFLSYERMWLRSAREKESGTYRRDLLRARRKGQQVPPCREVPPPPEAAPRSAVAQGAGASPAVSSASAPAPVAPVTRGTPPPVPTPRSAGVVAGGPDQAQLRALFTDYVAAKKRCNEDTSRMSLDNLSKVIAKQVPVILERYKALSVEFKVEVRDGRAVLKAVPRTGT